MDTTSLDGSFDYMFHLCLSSHQYAIQIRPRDCKT